MQIEQVLWTADHSPLEHSFGWLRLEYNLMPWAFSNQCLRMYFENLLFNRIVLCSVSCRPIFERHMFVQSLKRRARKNAGNHAIFPRLQHKC